MDINSIHPNKLRYLSRLGYKYDAYALRRFEEIKRYFKRVRKFIEMGNIQRICV